MAHVSLQFGGADVLLRSPPEDFRSRAEAWIEKETGFRVELVEKANYFPDDFVMRDAVDVERAPFTGRNSSLAEKGNCISLAMYRLIGSPDLPPTLRASSGLPIRRALEFGRTENVSD